MATKSLLAFVEFLLSFVAAKKLLKFFFISLLNLVSKYCLKNTKKDVERKTEN
jgi:hypothetical protein